MPTPLSNEQIDSLFEFVKSKYVDFYDVQVELVDHLASEIEQQLITSPGITFDTALQQVYARFGIFGFSDLVEQKQIAVNKRSRLLWWRYVTHMFRFPILVGSLIGGMLFFIAFDFFKPIIFVHINALFSFLAVLGTAMYYFKNYSQ